MGFKWWAVAAILALAPSAAFAVTEANFDARTTADLVELCDAKADAPMGVAAVNFCHGFAQGAVVVELQNLGGRRDAKMFCLPEPLPSRNQAVGEFVQWARASPDRLAEPATNGLIHFLVDRFPCPKAR